MIRVCLVGLGKTGIEISKTLLEQKHIRLVAVICSPNSSKNGKDLGEILGRNNTGIFINSSDNIEEVIFKTKPDVVVDFSNPLAAVKNAKIFSKMKTNIVIGTTGFSETALKRLLILTRKYHNGIVYAPNITLGVNVMMLLTNLAASILSNYDFQITEVHHKNKKDVPSGTALKISREIEKGLISSGLDADSIHIPIAAIRAGGIVGKHEVMIVGEDDKIEISHESFSRKAFAAGAIRAVEFIYGKTGYFEMSDVLNMKKVLNSYMEKQNNRGSKLHKHFGQENSDSTELLVL